MMAPARDAFLRQVCRRSQGGVQSLKDNEEELVAPRDMLAELSADNQQLTRSLRNVHAVWDEHNDVATASLIENWIDETERRARFLSETLNAR
jgi:starvation-inducible DNA-binding protein